MLREGEDATEYPLERTSKSLMRPSPVGGPYLSQEGDTFFAEKVEGDTIYGCRYGHGSRSVQARRSLGVIVGSGRVSRKRPGRSTWPRPAPQKLRDALGEL